MVSENNESAYGILINKYQPLIEKYARYYCTMYAKLPLDREELIQEGTIGLMNAIKQYEIEENCLFYTFAILVVRREMERYIKKCCRNKQLILTNAVSLSQGIGNDDLEMQDVISDNSCNVEDVFYNNYFSRMLYEFKYNLSDVQASIYELRLNSFTNKEIAQLLDVKYKTVDNCLQFIKPKLQNYLQSLDL